MHDLFVKLVWLWNEHLSLYKKEYSGTSSYYSYHSYPVHPIFHIILVQLIAHQIHSILRIDLVQFCPPSSSDDLAFSSVFILLYMPLAQVNQIQCYGPLYGILTLYGIQTYVEVMIELVLLAVLDELGIVEVPDLVALGHPHRRLDDLGSGLDNGACRWKMGVRTGRANNFSTLRQCDNILVLRILWYVKMWKITVHRNRKGVSSFDTILSLGRFVSETFRPLGRIVSWDVVSLGTYCPLGRIVPWDVLSVGTFCHMGRFSLGRFVPGDVLSLGRFVLGRFVLGRIVCAIVHRSVTSNSKSPRSTHFATHHNPLPLYHHIPLTQSLHSPHTFT